MVLNDDNLEKSLLSAFFYNPQNLITAQDYINQNNFYNNNYKKIYLAMLDCLNNNEPIDQNFLKKHLKNDYDEEILGEIISISPVTNIIAYLKELQNISIKRELLQIATEIPKNIEEFDDAFECANEINSKIYSTTKISNSGSIKNVKEVIYDILDRYKKQKESNSEILGIDTGFYQLNSITKGFKGGELLVLAARPGMGKTTLALNLLSKPLKEEKSVVFFSFEMPAVDLVNKLACSISSTDLSKVLSARLADDEYTRFGDALNYLSNCKLYIHDGGRLNINQISFELKKMAQLSSLDLCVVDHIGIINPNNKDPRLHISEVTRELKMLSMELDIPILALSQLNRAVDSRVDKRPMLSDLRESGSIEQDADMVMFIYRDSIYKQIEYNEKRKKADMEGKEFDDKYELPEVEDAEIIIAKNRNGPLGKVILQYDKKSSRFINKDAPIMEKEFKIDT